jgi:hypothetical protein
MEIELKGLDAIDLAKEISKVPGLTFKIAFFKYSRAKNEASKELEVKEGCKVRAQLPQEQFSVDSDNFFLFTDSDGNPKMCYRYLIRYMGFPQDGFVMHKIKWIW